MSGLVRPGNDSLTSGHCPALPSGIFARATCFDPLYMNVEGALLPTLGTLKKGESDKTVFPLVRDHFPAK